MVDTSSSSSFQFYFHVCDPVTRIHGLLPSFLQTALPTHWDIRRSRGKRRPELRPRNVPALPTFFAPHLSPCWCNSTSVVGARGFRLLESEGKPGQIYAALPACRALRGVVHLVADMLLAFLKSKPSQPSQFLLPGFSQCRSHHALCPRGFEALLGSLACSSRNDQPQPYGKSPCPPPS